MPKAAALICQLEVPGDTILRAADQFEGLIIVNLAPAREIDERIIECANVLVVNETESDWYGDRLSKCRGLVVTTHGKDGAQMHRAGKRVASASAKRVDAIDTTGSGDAFTGALAVALAEGMSPEEALQFACAAGSLAATQRGAQPSLPTRDAVAALLSDD